MIVRNPISDDWYADPEARFYDGEYWIYVTKSLPYKEQINLDVLHSKDLIHWDVCKDIIDMSDFPIETFAVWAPTIIEKNGKYYLIFACNDIHSDEEIGGLEIVVSDNPAGPFRKYTETLIGCFINGAQPIDAHLFKDENGTVYLYYGGWGHCNVCKMNDNMDGFLPFSDGEIFKEITPSGYVEGPCMLKRKGNYYFMWSSGDWTKGTYAVNYAVSHSPIEGFREAKQILHSQLPIAEGPGHNGFLYLPKNNSYLIVYHRRIIGDSECAHRVLCIDKMNLHNGIIEPIIMTNEFEL